jgi:hypothetical protein
MEMNRGDHGGMIIGDVDNNGIAFYGFNQWAWHGWTGSFIEFGQKEFPTELLNILTIRRIFIVQDRSQNHVVDNLFGLDALVEQEQSCSQDHQACPPHNETALVKRAHLFSLAIIEVSETFLNSKNFLCVIKENAVAKDFLTFCQEPFLDPYELDRFEFIDKEKICWRYLSKYN